MKKILFFTIVQVGIINTAYAQPVQNNPANQNAAGANSAQYWSRQGNTLVNGTNNVIGFQAGSNSQVWFASNGVYRMMIDNGFNGINQGRISVGNDLPATFAPQDRMHL